jgi:hypothetical protein
MTEGELMPRKGYPDSRSCFIWAGSYGVIAITKQCPVGTKC